MELFIAKTMEGDYTFSERFEDLPGNLADITITEVPNEDVIALQKARTKGDTNAILSHYL